MGKIRLSLKIVPNVSKYIKSLKDNNNIDIKNFTSGSNGDWAQKILNFVIAHYPEMREYFSLTYMKSSNQIIKSTTGKLNDSYTVIEDAEETKRNPIIKNNVNKTFLDEDEFKKFFKVIKSINDEDSLMAKATMSFNNNIRANFMIINNKKEPLALTKRSLTYLSINDLEEVTKLLNYLNDLLTK